MLPTAVDGNGKEMLMMTELYGGARIAYIFNSIFCKKVQVGGWKGGWVGGWWGP
jgi:hypothetical protein